MLREEKFSSSGTLPMVHLADTGTHRCSTLRKILFSSVPWEDGSQGQNTGSDGSLLTAVMGLGVAILLPVAEGLSLREACA